MNVSNSNLNMKKYLLIFLPFLFFGCEKDFDGVIQPQQSIYNVIGTSSFDSFEYSGNDSVVTFFIKIDTSSRISRAYCDIYSSDNKKVNASPLDLFDNGNITNGDTIADDFIYSNNFVMSINYPNGRYNVRYYLADETNTSILAAVQTFSYDNGKNKIAPVLSDLQIPDTVSFNQTFTFSVLASDSNGLNDIIEVYYELFRPDGSQVSNSQGITKFPLFDDGVQGNDQTADDGRYTVFLTFPTGQQSGSWRFEFEARDRSSRLSNRIIHSLVVQ